MQVRNVLHAARCSLELQDAKIVKKTPSAHHGTLLEIFLVDKRKSSGSKVAGTFTHGSLN